MKQFLFLYPIHQYIDQEIKKGAHIIRDENKEKEFLKRLNQATSEHEKEVIRQEALQAIRLEFRVRYRDQLNACIDARYRQKDFGINYAVFDGSPVSDVIRLQRSDKIIQVGMNFETHTTTQANGEFPYPDPDYVLNQIPETNVLRIAGFHMWDCVEKIAKRAYERGLDTLVDEDLTEFFNMRLKDPDFKIDRYPSYNPRKIPGDFFEMFMAAREDKPWLWQEY